MKKIGIFTGYYLPHLGGVERYTEKLSEQLQKMGYKVVIVTSNHDHLKNIEKHDMNIYRLPIYNLFKARYPLPKKNKEFHGLIDQIEEEDFDYYICNTRFHLTTLIGCKMARKKKKPLLILDHGSSHFTVNNKVLDWFGEKYEHWLTNRLKKYHPKFYGVSNRCNTWLTHFNIQASGVLYNAIDSNADTKYCNKKYFKPKKDKVIITYAGRMIREKGIVLLLDAVTSLYQKFPNMELYVAGNGPILDELKQKYDKPYIHFEGKLNYDTVMSLYNVTDIFVYPSMFPEGLPTSILEAGIMECAVIATDRGGTVEVITDDRYGLIMEESTQDLMSKLERLLENPKEIEIMKKNLHRRVKKSFTWESTAKKLQEILKEL